MIYETLLSTMTRLEELTGEKQELALQVSEETYFKLCMELDMFNPKGFKFPPHVLELYCSSGQVKVTVRKVANAI